MKKVYTFCFDIDNTICKTFKNDYKNSQPYKKKIKFINELYNRGHNIIFFTARGMGSLKSKKKAEEKYFKFTLSQLKKWNVKYNKLLLGKPSWDFFIDDKNLGFSKNWEKQIKKIIKLK